MVTKIYTWLNKKYPQNFILKKPLFGSFIFLLFCFIFMVIYRPLKTQASLHFGYPLTMAIYLFASAASVFILIHIIKSTPFFSVKNEWTFIREVLSILLILSGIGISFYFMGFLMEDPANRWNLPTFFDSCKYGFLIGIIPFGFFTLTNYRHLFVTEVSQEFGSENPEVDKISSIKEEKTQISSRLKKEELSFFPQHFVYAESDGNYVVFHLSDEHQVRTELIRNSMNEIEQQLSGINYIIRIHRAFMVNVKMVRSKKGNALGYRLKLYGTDTEIPVSRQNVQSFDQLLKQFR